MTEGKLAEICIFIGAAQKYKELCSLIKFIRQRIVPKNILEIGTGKGGSLWLWCQLADESGKVISIDLPDGDFGGGYSIKEQERFQNYKRGNQSLHFIRDNSHNIETEKVLSEILENRKLDILFIDGDHTFNGVKDDFHRYKKYVNNNGLIIFHDIVEHNEVTECQVKQFWDSISENYETFELIDEEVDNRGWGNWGGIGIMINK